MRGSPSSVRTVISRAKLWAMRSHSKFPVDGRHQGADRRERAEPELVTDARQRRGSMALKDWPEERIPDRKISWQEIDAGLDYGTSAAVDS